MSHALLSWVGDSDALSMFELASWIHPNYLQRKSWPIFQEHHPECTK
jgi:hypothetical protein